MSSIDTPAAEVIGGVTIDWLAKVFRMDTAAVRRKLADAPNVGRRTSGKLYDLKTAAEYLVRPRVNVETYIHEMDPKDLPVVLQPTYWEAQLKRQKWEKEAKHLWETEDVVDVLAEVLKLQKFTTQLWPDTVERMEGLNQDQRAVLIAACDDLNEQFYQQLVRMVNERSTPSALSRLDDAPTEETVIVDEDDVDDEIEGLI